MIKSEKGKVEISGNGLEINADMILISRSIKTHMMDVGIPEEMAEKEIERCIKDGFLSEEELRKRQSDRSVKLNRLLEEFIDIIKSK